MRVPDIETWSREKIAAYQEIRLKNTLDYVLNNSVFYKKHFEGLSINLSDSYDLKDLVKLPFTTKDDLQFHNQDFYCVNRNKIVDYAFTLGTAGEPVTYALTDSDLDRLAYNVEISLGCAGIKKGDVVQLMSSLDRQFLAGLSYFLGLRNIGAGVIRIGGGLPELQWDSILRNQPNYLIGVPSFLLKMIDYAEVNGIDYKNTSVKGVICIGEPLRNADFSPNELTNKILSKWDIKLYSSYSSTEMSTAFVECEYGVGGHHQPDMVIVEVVDEEGNQVKDGQSGELVITTLALEAMPLIRFKTGDIVQAHYEPCECGRSSLRIGPVEARKQHLIKYKGTTLYPAAMNNLLNGFDEIKGYFLEISSNLLGVDEIIMYLAVENPTDEFDTKITDHFRAKLRVSPRIEFVSNEDIEKKIKIASGQNMIDTRSYIF